jgi:hypothetical protein
VHFTKLAGLGVLLWMSCGQPAPLQRHADSSPVPSAAPAPPAVPLAERPREGSTIAVSPDGKELFVVDRPGRAILRAPLPITAASTFARTELPGTPGELVFVGDRLLVTVDDLLLWLKPDLGEAGRLALPAGARALAVDAAGKAALVLSSAALSAVDVQGASLRWSVDVPAATRDLVWSADGARASVTHLVGPGATTVELNGAAPVVTPATGNALRVDGVGALGPDGATVLVHGRWQGGGVSPELASDDETWHADALADGAFARAVKARPGKGTLLVATDEELVELSAEHATVSRSSLDRCRDASGIALSPDEATAWVACEGGASLRVVTLGASSVRVATQSEPAPVCGEQGTEKISASFKKRFLRFDRVEKVLQAYRCRYPDRTELIDIADTHGKRKVKAIVIGPDARLDHERPSFFINGGHHGDELLAVNFALDAVAALLEENVAASGPLAELTFVVAPLVNPDGNWHRLEEGLFGRKNGRDNNHDGQREHREGVDLNRNYPFRWGTLGESGSSSKPKNGWYRGPSAASEPEVQGVMRLAQNEKFVAAMSFHTGTLALLAPYTIPFVKQPEPDAAWVVAQEVLSAMPEHPEGPAPLMRRLYALDGCDQDWLRHEHGTLALLWEGGKKWLAMDPVRGEMIASARGSWMELAKRAMAGPTISGRVLDASGRPVVADVAVAEVKLTEGERWESRCRDGRFDQVLAGPGEYTLVVSAGGSEVRRKVTVAAGKRTHVDVVLPVLVTRPAVCATAAEAEGDEAVLTPLATP